MQVLFADVVFMCGGCADVSPFANCRSRVTFIKYLFNIIRKGCVVSHTSYVRLLNALGVPTLRM
jgi:hypothetical protein